jgi:hypothetical protein
MPKPPRNTPPEPSIETGTDFVFTIGDATYHLPPVQTAIATLPGKYLRDAYMDGANGDVRLGFAMLENADVDEAIVAAIYDVPGPRMLSIISDWMQYTPANEATVPES